MFRPVLRTAIAAAVVSLALVAAAPTEVITPDTEKDHDGDKEEEEDDDDD